MKHQINPNIQLRKKRGMQKKLSSVLFNLCIAFSPLSFAQPKPPSTTKADLKTPAPKTADWITQQHKLEPFTSVYLKGPLRIKIDGHTLEPRLELKGEKAIVKKAKIWMQSTSKKLHLTAPEAYDSKQISITLYAPQLEEIYHQSSEPVHIQHIRAPISITASGIGVLHIDDILSPFLSLQGIAKSQIQLSGRIETLEANLQGYASLDTTQSYIQRSFIKTQDHAFAITGPNERSFAAVALDHSLIRYTHDAPVQGLFAQYKAWIVRTLSK